MAGALALLVAAVGLLGSSSSAAPLCAGFGIDTISPAAGFVTGNTSVTISGCGFSGPGTLTVTFGSASPIAVSPHTNPASLTVMSPAGAAGPVDVVVRLMPTPSGTDSVATATNGFTYVAKPAITKIAPTSGPEAGGTSVHVTGSALTSAVTGATTSVKFGTTAATSLSNLTPTSLKATSPAGTGTQDVTVKVELPGGESATSNGKPFKYVPAPTVTSVSPTSGPLAGGTDVTVTGTHFQPGARVLFGPSDGSTDLKDDAVGTPVSVLSDTSILVTTPPGAVGATNVVVVNPDGQIGALKSASAGHYSYTGTAPSITTVSPATGTSLGGTVVTITGAGFLPLAKVAFAAAGEVSPPLGRNVSVSAGGTQITATAPAHAGGSVDVIVTNVGGGKATKTDGFSFTAVSAPTVTSLSVNTGPSLGGTAVTISGSNFVAGTTVSFGGTPATSAAVINATTIAATTPAHAAGAVGVTVTLPDGQSHTLASAFTFVLSDPPTITSIMPIAGGPSGTEITINGTGFATTVAPSNAASPAIVSVGAASACVPGQTSASDSTCLEQIPPDPSCTMDCFHPIVQSPILIVGRVPNAPGEAKTVTVKNPDGQIATSTFTNTGPAGSPTLTSISPDTADTLGHTVVHLTGTKFARGARVTFGASGKGGSGTVTNVSSDGTTIDATAPAGVYGTVDVTVVNPDPGHSPSTVTATLEDGFTFTAAPRPIITSIDPVSGPGGTEVTITGTGFAHTNGASTNAVAPAVVTVGGQQLLLLPPPSTDPVVLDDTTITGLIPTAPEGAVDVAVMNPDGQGAILVGGYTYPADTTAPMTTAVATTVGGGSYTFSTWAKGSVAIALKATDDTSGVRDISFSSTGAQNDPATVLPGASRSATVTAHGKTTISYFASDNASNVEVTNTREVWIDKVAPSITTTATIPSGGGTIAYTAGTKTGQDVTVKFECTDADSGFASLTFEAPGSTTTVSPPGPPGSNPLSVKVTSSGDNQSVKGTCTDAVGNKTSSTFGRINIAKTAPSIDVAATIAGGTPYTAGVWVNRTVTVTFTCTPISPSNQIVSVTGPVLVHGPETNRTVSGTCIDQAGNSSTVTFGTPIAGIDIDRTLPVATAAATTTNNSGATIPYAAGTWTNHNVVVTFHCTDGGTSQSGVDSVDPPVTVSAAGTTNGVIGNCTDVAGNHANPPAFFGPIKIDKTAPTCTAAVIPATLTGNGKLVNVMATVFVTDASSGPNGSVLKSITSNNPATAGSDIVGFTVGAASYKGQLRATRGRVYTFTYQAFDVAQNASPLCTAVVRVP